MPRALRRRPFRHHIVNRRAGRINRRHDLEFVRIGVVNLKRVARIVFMGAERRHHDHAVAADIVHDSDHSLARNGAESVRGLAHGRPG